MKRLIWIKSIPNLVHIKRWKFFSAPNILISAWFRINMVFFTVYLFFLFFLILNSLEAHAWLSAPIMVYKYICLLYSFCVAFVFYFSIDLIQFKRPIEFKAKSPHEHSQCFDYYIPGPSCSKLTTSLVNDSLKFTLSDRKYAKMFCWKNVSSFCSACKSYSHFFSKKYQNIVYWIC